MTHHTIRSFAAALGQRPFYTAAWNLVRRFEDPADALKRYVFGTGSYPYRFRILTPLGTRSVVAYHYHDVLTIVEAFGKVDYPLPTDAALVVDVGANIGISALYFLTRNPQVRVEMYEPVADNVEKAKITLAGFEGRYEIHPEAVAPRTGTASFAEEPTGRYGGIVTERYIHEHGLDRATEQQVPTIGTNQLIDGIREEFGTIDLLKLDVEWLEEPLLRSLSDSSLSQLERIYAETEADIPLPGFRRRRYGSIVRYARRRGSQGWGWMYAKGPRATSGAQPESPPR